MPLNSKMQQTKNIRNELLKRNEIEGVVMAEKNPTFDEMRKVIADKFSAPEEGQLFRCLFES